MRENMQSTMYKVGASKPVRVLHVITSLLTGGAEAMLQKVVRATRPLGYESTVVSLTAATTIGRELKEEGVPVVALGGRGGILLPHQFLRLVGIVRRVRPQIVHCWMYHSNAIGHALVRLNSRRKRPALVVSVRVALDARYDRKVSRDVIRKVDALLSGAADAVVFNSHRAAEQHAALGYCMHRARVIPNCFDTEYFRPSLEESVRLRRGIGCDVNTVLVGMVTRFDTQKGQRSFLRAAQMVAARFSSCRFLLAGRGCDRSNAELMQWIQDYGLLDRVHLLGERRDMPAVQGALDVAVSASIVEGFPNTIGEAMACAVPCVVTDVGDCNFVVGDGGFVVPPGDTDALASAITGLVGLPAHERKAIGDRGRKRVMAEFAMAPVVEKFTELYEDVRLSTTRRTAVA